jgi:hypothetical protein
MEIKTFIVLPVLMLAITLHGAEIKETYPDGKLKVRYSVDDMKRKTGIYEEFHPGGKLKLRGQYALGKKSGMWVSHDEKTGKIVESWMYRNDLRDGPYIWNLPSGKAGLKATYRLGQLYGPILVEDEKGKLRRISYPRTRDEVEKTVIALYFNETPEVKFTAKPDVKAPYKAGVLTPETLDAALKLTRLYRFLSGMPSDGMKVDSALSEHAAFAAVLHAKTDTGMMMAKLEKPTDMDNAFFQNAMAGDKESITFRGSNPVNAVRNFMDSSQDREAAAVVHRQWLLSPGLSRVGFGAAKQTVAMNISDGGRPAKVDYAYVAFPGEGYYPKALVDAQAPWSVFVNAARAKIDKMENISVSVQKLDDHYQPQGGLIPTTVTGTPAAPNTAFGWHAIVFKPEFSTLEAARYWVQIDGVQTLAGAEAPFGYLVELINVVIPEKIAAKGPAGAPAAPPTAEEMKKKKLDVCRAFLGKTVLDLQFGGRRAKMIPAETDTGSTYQIDDPGEPTIIKVNTDADGKIVMVSVDGQVLK